jgi:hypothetical protein
MFDGTSIYNKRQLLDLNCSRTQVFSVLSKFHSLILILCCVFEISWFLFYINISTWRKIWKNCLQQKWMIITSMLTVEYSFFLKLVYSFKSLRKIALKIKMSLASIQALLLRFNNYNNYTKVKFDRFKKNFRLFHRKGIIFLYRRRPSQYLSNLTMIFEVEIFE